MRKSFVALMLRCDKTLERRLGLAAPPPPPRSFPRSCITELERVLNLGLTVLVKPITAGVRVFGGDIERRRSLASEV